MSKADLPPLPRAAAPSLGRLRVVVLDRDVGFGLVLARRMNELGWDHETSATFLTPRKLLGMRLDAVVVDVGLLGNRTTRWLEALSTPAAGPAIVVCSQADEPDERVLALCTGADDWLNKPCHPEELVARIEAVVRQRRRLAPPTEPLVIGDVEVRRGEFQAYVGGVSLKLTRREFQVIDALASEPDETLTREVIYERVWGRRMPREDRAVDVVVHKVRRKLLGVAPGCSYIHTHPAVGYSFSRRREDLDRPNSDELVAA